jgi:hypothetical protein
LLVRAQRGVLSLTNCRILWLRYLAESGSAARTSWIPQYCTEEFGVEVSHISRKSGSIPAYSLHRSSGQAIVRICGHDHYLGPHNSSESREKYDRLIAEWLANCRRSLFIVAAPQEGLLVNEVLLKWEDFIIREYGNTTEPSKELANLRIAVRSLKNLYGRSFAKDFGPLALKSIREHLVETKRLCRKEINKRISRIKRVFKWPVSEELVPPFVFEALRTVDGLRLGGTTARENPPVVSVAPGRGLTGLQGIFLRLKRARAKIEAVATDMAGGYIAAVLKYLPTARLVSGHFHGVKLMNEKLTAQGPCSGKSSRGFAGCW